MLLFVSVLLLMAIKCRFLGAGPATLVQRSRLTFVLCQQPRLAGTPASPTTLEGKS